LYSKHISMPNFAYSVPIFWEKTPEILDLDYKIEHISDRSAKFRGDWQTI